MQTGLAVATRVQYMGIGGRLAGPHPGDHGVTCSGPGARGVIECAFGKSKVMLNRSDVRRVASDRLLNGDKSSPSVGSQVRKTATLTGLPEVHATTTTLAATQKIEQRVEVVTQSISPPRLLGYGRRNSKLAPTVPEAWPVTEEDTSGEIIVDAIIKPMGKTKAQAKPKTKERHARSRHGSKRSAQAAAGVPPAVRPDPEEPEPMRPHPPSFYCPISHQCMHDPVILTDGHAYERRHIEKWLKHNDTSPVSGAKLEQKTVFPNHALRNAIQEYFEQVLDGHRQAIRQATVGLTMQGNFSSNETFLHTVDALMQCSILVNADLCIERVLKRIMEEAKTLVGAEVASVFLVDHQRGELYSNVNSTTGELRIPMNSGIAGYVAYSGESLIIDDAYGDSRFNTAVDNETGFTTRNILCVPIRAWNGGIIGVAQLINKTESGVLMAERGRSSSGRLDFTIDDRQFFQVLAAQAGAAIVGSGMFERITEDARMVRKSPRTSRSPDKYRRRTGSKQFIKPPSLEDEVPLREDLGLCPTQLITVKPLLAAAVDSWETDTLNLAELTDSRPLSVLAKHLFESCGLVDFFAMDRPKLDRFLKNIERGYPDTNPYHNRAHAASVVHFMYALLCHGGIAEAAAIAASGVEDPDRRLQLIKLAGLLAAVVHDFEHEGCNNDFLIKTRSHKAVRYNDRSPNENHHVAAAFAVLFNPECDFLGNLTDSERQRLRSLVIEMVLSTDMGDNEKFVKSFNAAVSSKTVASDESAQSGARHTFTPTSAEEGVLILQLALKCADVGHLALNWGSHMRWVRRVEAEFFAQGDNEKKLGMPKISFLMDREKPGVTETQVGFFKFVALPLFRGFLGNFPQACPMLSAVEANYQRWVEVEAQIELGDTRIELGEL